MNSIAEPIVTIATAIIGVAILSVLVSQRSQTAGVLQAFGNMFSNMLSAATGPVTGAVTAPNVGSANTNFGNVGSFNMPTLPAY